jgi:hypothetical protein
MLTIDLKVIPTNAVVGIYGPKEDQLPTRARYLHPHAAEAYLQHLAGSGIVVSDMYRSAESSLAAVRAGRGAKAPGYSAHNYGMAIDLDVGRSMKARSFATKKQLDAFMEHAGFFCHRRDHLITPLKGESHHFNFLGPGALIPVVKSTSGLIEAKILLLYGIYLAARLSNLEVQECLKKLRLYSGDLDGDLGPLSRQAVRVFQRGWGITETGKLDSKTQRTLVFVACEKRIES